MFNRIAMQLEMPAIYDAHSKLFKDDSFSSGEASSKFDTITWTQGMKRLYTLLDR